MYHSAYDLKAFYKTRMGRIVRRILQKRIRDIWPDTHGLRVMGYGYAVPYLREFIAESERCFSMMSAGHGAHHWPQNEKNLVCLSEESELPLETASIDRIITVHSLEFSEMFQASLQEIWRVLKSNGRLMVIVPNRSGFWARTDGSPFGQGTPYSVSQLKYYLHDNLFSHEETYPALFMPPLHFSPILKSAQILENFGVKFMPFGAGVHIIEATKQLYAKSGPNTGSKIMVRGRNIVHRPVPQGFNRDS